MKTLAFVFAVAFARGVSGAPPELEIRIVYDNTSAGREFAADWGFSALVSYGGRNILFDAGTKADLFAANFRKLGIDPKSVSQVVISHEHADHTGGITWLAPLDPSLVFHYLDRFPRRLYDDARKIRISPGRVTGPAGFAPGIYSTGAIDGAPPEQALLVETTKGLVVVTGCSHPGIVKIIETAEKQRGKNSVRLLVGGFHMLKDSPEQIGSTVARLRQLRVDAIVPTHCTGDLATAKFREAYGANFDTGGAGKRIVLD